MHLAKYLMTQDQQHNWVEQIDYLKISFQYSSQHDWKQQIDDQKLSIQYLIAIDRHQHQIEKIDLVHYQPIHWKKGQPADCRKQISHHQVYQTLPDTVATKIIQF